MRVLLGFCRIMTRRQDNRVKPPPAKWRKAAMQAGNAAGSII
jgi:hypothetical protein